MCVAIPAQVVEFCDPERFLARVEMSGVRRVVNAALVSGGPERAEPGDWVLVHAGCAISQVDEAEARATVALLEEIADAHAEELSRTS